MINQKEMKLLCLAALVTLTASQASAQLGVYVGGFAGGTFVDDLETEGVNSGGTKLEIEETFDAGFIGGGVLGYRLPPSSFGTLRVEGEFAFRTSDVDELTFQNVIQPMTSGEIEVTSGMFNAYLDLTSIHDRFVPYIGGGIGIAGIDRNILYGIASFDDDDTVFAYQFMGGILVRIGENFDIFGEARYFATADSELERFGGPPPLELATLDSEYATLDVIGGIHYRF